MDHHEGRFGVHSGNKELDLYLKQTAQQEFEKKHSKEEFIQIFGKSFL